jgi:hypothetical protein
LYDKCEWSKGGEEDSCKTKEDPEDPDSDSSLNIISPKKIIIFAFIVLVAMLI